MQLGVGAAIRALREDRGWSQKELGEKADGLNKSTVNRVELGANTEVDTLLKITRALGVELEIALRQPQARQQQVIRDRADTSTGVSLPVTLPLDSGEALGKEPRLVIHAPSDAHAALCHHLFSYLKNETDASAFTTDLLRALTDFAERRGRENEPQAGAR
jgi:transcriptional regulator with XRE-family HTH domain